MMEKSYLTNELLFFGFKDKKTTKHQAVAIKKVYYL